MAISSPKASNARSCLPWPCAIHHISGHILGSSGKTGSNKPWASDPLYPAPHYALNYWSSILIAWHGSWLLLSAEWSQIWTLWHIPPAGGCGLPFLSPLTLTPLLESKAVWGAPMSNERAAMEVYTYYRCYHHNHTWWNSVDSCCFSSLKQNAPDKGENPGVSTIGTPQAINNRPICTFFQVLRPLPKSCPLWVKNSENLLFHRYPKYKWG